MTMTLDHTPAHADIDHTLTAAGYDHTDTGAGFSVPDLAPFVMHDREVLRWLEARGIRMLLCVGCDRVFCVCPGKQWGAASGRRSS